MSVDVYFGSAGELMTVAEHGGAETFRIIANGPSIYMEANGAFWLANTNHNRAAASLFAGRWIDVTSDKKDFGDVTKSLSKESILSQCRAGGSATYAGTAVVNGMKVIKIHHHTTSESDTFYIEKGPTPYILKLTGSQSQKDSGDVLFSDYGVQPHIAAPAGAIPFSYAIISTLSVILFHVTRRSNLSALCGVRSPTVAARTSSGKCAASCSGRRPDA